jgi:hypothetical protein
MALWVPRMVGDSTANRLSKSITKDLINRLITSNRELSTLLPAPHPLAASPAQ